jgi:hypothetical protein
MIKILGRSTQPRRSWYFLSAVLAHKHSPRRDLAGQNEGISFQQFLLCIFDEGNHTFPEAGRQPINLEELLRLQRIVIGDSRLVRSGLRREGGFVGEHDRQTRMPLPDHISGRPDDLVSLIDGMVAFDRGP